MADIFRGPILVNRREPSPAHNVVAFVVPSLLVTTLAVTALNILPITAAKANYTAPHDTRMLVLNADTSRGMPKTLYADAQLPANVKPNYGPNGQPIAQWLPADTSRGTPKTLTADAQLPTFSAPKFAPVNVPGNGVLPADTTRGQPITLQVVLPPVPIVNVPKFDAQRFWWQPADTSRGTPKALTADAQLPVQNYQHSQPDRVRPVADTSQSSYGTTNVAVIQPIPIGKTSYVAAPIWPWINPDTTQESPPVAIQNVAPAPVVVVPVTQTPQRGGLGKRKKELTYEDWQSFVEYKQEIKAPIAEVEQIPVAVKQVVKAIRKARQVLVDVPPDDVPPLVEMDAAEVKAIQDKIEKKIAQDKKRLRDEEELLLYLLW